jgi:hypothetical protein
MQLKYTLEKINYAIAAQRNPEFMLLFTTWGPKTRVRAPAAAGLQQVVLWFGSTLNILAV